jgi:hypothetical protein
MIAVVLPIAVALLFPFALVIENLAGNPDARAVIAERPSAAIQLVLAFALLVSLFWWPLARLVRSLVSWRSITIDRHSVTITERGLFGLQIWSEPLSSYTGLAHHVRASLSGLRHELLLVHPDHAHSVLLAVAPRIAPEQVQEAAKLLGLAEISSREAYRLTLAGGAFGPAEPQPRLGIART